MIKFLKDLEKPYLMISQKVNKWHWVILSKAKNLYYQ